MIHKQLIASLLLIFIMSNSTLSSIAQREKKLSDCLKEYEATTTIAFIYNPEEIKDIYINYTCPFNIDELIKLLHKNQLHGEQIGNYFIIKRTNTIHNQTINNFHLVTGYITDHNSNPISNAIITTHDYNIVSISDSSGFFFMSIPLNTKYLHFQHISYNDEVLSLNNISQSIKVVLEEKTYLMDDIVINGMQDINKNNITGSYSSIETNRINTLSSLGTVDNILAGNIAGLSITGISGAPGTRSKITIRGENNLSGFTEPLWILDGLPMLSGIPAYIQHSNLAALIEDGIANISPHDIQSITILKDASACAIYGARAANGVIVIKTKQGYTGPPTITYSGNFSISHLPKVNTNFMSSTEKLEYENSLIDTYGFSYSTKLGRGGLLRNSLIQNLLTNNEYQRQINQLKKINTNWFQELFRIAQSHQHHLNIRGGTNKSHYYFSLNYSENEGILQSNKYKNLGLVLKSQYMPNSKFDIETTIQPNHRKHNDHASAINPFKYAIFANPYEQVYNSDGSYASDLTYLANNYNTVNESYKFHDFNIIKELSETSRQIEALDFNLMLRLKYTPISSIKMESLLRGGISRNSENISFSKNTYTSYIHTYFADNTSPSTGVLNTSDSFFSKNIGNDFHWVLRNQIEYNTSFFKKHGVSLLVANEISNKKYINHGYNAPIFHLDYSFNGIPNLSDNIYNNIRKHADQKSKKQINHERTISLIGCFNYNFKERYVLNINLRSDGSSKMGAGKLFTPLWSIGTRYNVHKEHYFNSTFFNEISVYGSYGYTGNINNSIYPYSTISYGDQIYEGNLVVDNYFYPNPPVGWERKLDRNLGLYISFNNRKHQLTIDYYNNITSDILELIRIPISTGRPDVKTNGGSVQNMGIELSGNFTILNTPNFRVTSKMNVAYNKNHIVQSRYNFDNYLETHKNNSERGGIINIEGGDVGAVYGWKSAGVDANSGNPRYYLTDEGKRQYGALIDAWDSYSPTVQNAYIQSGMIPSLTMTPDYITYDRTPITDPHFTGKQTPNVLLNSMQYLGASIPKFVGGATISMEWKNIEITTQCYFKTGYIKENFNELKHAPNNSIQYPSDLSISGTNRNRQFMNYWKKQGDITHIPRFVPENYQDYWAMLHTSDKYSRGDFLKINYLAINYHFPQQLTRFLLLRRMDLGLSISNLCTLSKYKGLDVDNSMPFDYPNARTYSIKLSMIY